MRYRALACDYDGTLAHHGIVEEKTVAALHAFRATGRKLILVTGRELDDLLRIFPRTDLFDLIVAENGALLYRPSNREERVLGQKPPERFLERLRESAVQPLSVGRVIVATSEPHETAVLRAIRDLGLELQVIFNKGAVMVLPSGINKATGLQAALKELGLSVHNVVGVGDAENDHAFLERCECGVVVANGLPPLKEKADWVTEGSHGEGVIELVEHIAEDDLAFLEARLTRHELVLGTGFDGQTVRLPPHGVSALLAGTSGGGKSTLVSAFVERLAEKGYQACIIDPEGDYPDIEHGLVLGDGKTVPSPREVTQALQDPSAHVVVNLIGVKVEDRPVYFQKLLPSLLEMRSTYGRPHWLVVDEVHHVLPENWTPSPGIIPAELKGILLVTVHPDHVAAVVLSSVDFVLAIGRSPAETVATFCRQIGVPTPEVPRDHLETGEAILWARRRRAEPVGFRSNPPKAERRRHSRKYMQGELSPEDSFYFEGPRKKLRLRAQNLQVFLQLAEGIDDETWDFHLKRNDFSRWFEDILNDRDLAGEVQAVEADTDLSSRESRQQIRKRIEERYTAPA